MEDDDDNSNSNSNSDDDVIGKSKRTLTKKPPPTINTQMSTTDRLAELRRKRMEAAGGQTPSRKTSTSGGMTPLQKLQQLRESRGSLAGASTGMSIEFRKIMTVDYSVK